MAVVVILVSGAPAALCSVVLSGILSGRLGRFCPALSHFYRWARDLSHKGQKGVLAGASSAALILYWTSK
jgi:hypothetical protein